MRSESPSLVETDFCVIDTETTGGSATHHRVIDVAVYHYRDGIILNKFHSLVNPGRPIPDWITMLTGIDDAMVRTAPSFSDIAGELKKFLDRGIFVAHNASFDYGFIRGEFERLGVAWERPKLCTVRLARRLYPELPSRSLGVLCGHFQIDIYDRHRAAGDAEATVYVLKHLLKKAEAEHAVSSLNQLEALLSARTRNRMREKKSRITPAAAISSDGSVRKEAISRHK